MHVVTRLSDSLDASFSLFEPRRVPGHVYVHLRAETLEIEALASRVRSAHQSYLTFLDAVFD